MTTNPTLTPITDEVVDRIADNGAKNWQPLIDQCRTLELQVAKAIGLHDRNIELAELNQKYRDALKNIRDLDPSGAQEIATEALT